jgi:hypothetical protein
VILDCGIVSLFDGIMVIVGFSLAVRLATDDVTDCINANIATNSFRSLMYVSYVAATVFDIRKGRE